MNPVIQRSCFFIKHPRPQATLSRASSHENCFRPMYKRRGVLNGRHQSSCSVISTSRYSKNPITSTVMKVILFVFAVLGLASAAPRQKRQAYALPDGAEILVGAIRTTFSCFADGYYADVDNNCKIFHVCHTALVEGGPPETQQWSFLCGNQTVFNQLSLTCADSEEAIPCSNAADFFYVNDRVRTGDPKLYFLHDDDIERAVPLIPALYSHALRTGGDVSNTVRRG